MSQLLWTQKQDIGPGARSNLATVFDSRQLRVVLFGGLAANSPLNDTWEWDGENWTQFADIGPPARSDHAMAYDSARGRVVLFGGFGRSGGLGTYLSDTWEWDGHEWTQIEDTGPAPRSGMAMCFDSARGRVLLFGGSNGTTSFADTWIWDGLSWTQEQDAGPPARTLHGMDYDSVRNRAVLFGGLALTSKQVTVSVPDGGISGWFGGTHTEIQTQTTTQYFNDTWEYDGLMWTSVADIGPSPRSAFGFSYSGKVVLLFGGRENNNVFGDTWQWNGARWTERQDIGPAGRGFAGSAYDSTRQRMVLFGGGGVQGQFGQPPPFGDTWELAERA